MEFRKTLSVNPQAPLEIFVDGENIILHKYEPSCTFCGKSKHTTFFKGKLVCESCLNEMQSTLTQGYLVENQITI